MVKKRTDIFKEFADEKKISTNIEFYRDDRLIQDINNNVVGLFNKNDMLYIKRML